MEVGVQVGPETRQGDLIGGGAAADLGVALDDQHPQAGPGQIRGGDKAVVARADDDSVYFLHA